MPLGAIADNLAQMPYDPRNPGIFQDILKRLRDEGNPTLSSAMAITIVHDWRQREGKTRTFSIHRHTLTRFRDGENIQMPGLSDLWEALEAHPDYAWAFRTEEKAPPTGLYDVLSQFWRIDPDIQSILPGMYQFFARSEEFPDHVVFGAMKIAVNDRGETIATEWQRRYRSQTIVETWSGPALATSGRVVMLLSPNGVTCPKVYFLNFRIANKVGQDAVSIEDMRGIMTKVGKTPDPFQSGVYLYQKHDAFEYTEVVNRTALPGAYPEEIKSDPVLIAVITSILYGAPNDAV